MSDESGQVQVKKEDCSDWAISANQTPFGGVINIPHIGKFPEDYEKRLDAILPKMVDPKPYPYQE